MCFFCFSEQAKIISLSSINRLVFLIKAELCSVRYILNFYIQFRNSFFRGVKLKRVLSKVD
jgi:hypothetical protein